MTREEQAKAERRAIYAILKAWRNPGPNPDYHFKQRALLQSNWPALADAIRNLSNVSNPDIGRNTRPTVAEMDGLFDGPDSVEWLRQQRGGGHKTMTVEYGCAVHNDDHLDCCCSERCLWRTRRTVTAWEWAHPSADNRQEEPPDMQQRGGGQ